MAEKSEALHVTDVLVSCSVVLIPAENQGKGRPLIRGTWCIRAIIMPAAEELSAWETYEAAGRQQARNLHHRRSIQVDGARRSSARVPSAGGRQSVFNANRPHSIAISQIAGIDLKALEEAADEAEKELAARRSQAYSTQYSQFFDQLGFDRRKEDGRDEDKEKGFVKRNLPYRVQEDLIRIFEVYFEGHTHFEERQREEYDSRFRRLLRSINGTMPWIQ